jgi:protein-S-isoprenylcysteine O-methyltransferase Ste14
MTPERAVYFIWFVWAFSWMAAAFWANRTVAVAGARAEAPFRVVTSIGSILLFAFATGSRDFGWPLWRVPGWNMLVHPFWHVPGTFGWILAGVSVLGFGFTWWARLHLGRLWSAAVTRKEGHRVVDTGPYRLVRHPIYTGVILAGAVIALLKASALAAIGFMVFTASFVLKGKLEERFLREQLGAEAYDGYSRRTPMLVPFL